MSQILQESIKHLGINFLKLFFKFFTIYMISEYVISSSAIRGKFHERTPPRK